MGKQFKLADDARSDQIVPALGSREVKRGDTVEFPDEYVDGLQGNADWQPVGWAWPEPAPVVEQPETPAEAVVDPTPPTVDAAPATPAVVEPPATPEAAQPAA